MSTSTGPIRGRLEALQQRLSQSVETVTRSSPKLFVKNTGVDDLSPPDDIDKFHKLYRELGIVCGNINQFVRDVVEPGVRINADDPVTQAYFTGEGTDEADLPDFAPPGGFLDNCAVIAGERNKPFYPYLKSSIVQKYTRGTALHEYLKSDEEKDDPDFKIQGFKHIRPETVSARVRSNTNILIGPDETNLAEETTRRNEAAAYVQFDDQSILGKRRGGLDEDSVALSQNDVLKQVNNPDIGGDKATEDGVFGTSPLEAAADDATDYRTIKRNRAEAIKTKVEGVWIAEFTPTAYDLGDETLIQEWTDDEQDDWVSGVNGLSPGSILGHDGSVDLDQWVPNLPDLDDDLQHLVDDILAPLPAPKYATAHGDDITQHVSDEQAEAYRDLVGEERKAQERDWTQAFREVANRHPDLKSDGIEVRIAPKASSNPVAELSDEEIQRMEQFMSALDSGLGDVPVDTVLDLQAFLQTTMDLPDEVFAGSEVDADEAAADLTAALEQTDMEDDE